MAIFTASTDTVLHVYQTLGSNKVGHASVYTSEEHPGTHKKIEGWKWDKRTWPEPLLEVGLSFVPSVWDPTLSGLNESHFQSGYGDNRDLFLLGFDEASISGLDIWAPKVNHGYFYVHDEEWYLFSDSYQTEYFSSAVTISGMQYLDLSMVPKPTVPIRVYRYEFDDVLGRYEISTSFRKKVEFTSVSGFNEFRVDTSVSPPRLWLDGIYTEKVGEPLTLVGGVLPGGQSVMEVLDFTGLSDGSANQIFNLQYSPVDPDADVQVWVYQNYTVPQEYEVVSGQSDFVSSSFQVILDKDIGFLKFGDWDGSSGAGMIPPAGYRVSVHYTKGIVVHYEPENTQDDVVALDANVNPVTAATSKGFVQVSTVLGDPASVELTSALPTASPIHVIDLGNNTGVLLATVKDALGRVLEGEQVTFNIQDPQVGTFGGVLTSTSSVTGGDGIARATYNSPLTINDIGQVTTSVSWEGPNTKVTVDGISVPTEVSGVYLYKVHSYDLVLGIPASGLDAYYEDYLIEIEAVSGVQATAAFEAEYRTEAGLDDPTTYNPSETSVGKKTLLVTKKPLADRVLNPKTGLLDADAYSPLYPISITDTGTLSSPQFELVYSGIQLDIPQVAPPVDSDVTKGYFFISDANTSIQATVVNSRSGRTISSNVLDLRTEIPNSANGTFACSTLSAVPSGLLTKTVDVTGLTDDQILVYSGLQWDSYIDERQGIYNSVLGQWDVDADTVGLWHLDQDLVDEVTSNSAANYGMTPVAGGLVDGGYKVTASGQWIAASGIFGVEDMSQGTYEFYYKPEWPDGLADGGASDFGDFGVQALFSVAWGHPTDSQLRNSLGLWFWKTFSGTERVLSTVVSVQGDSSIGTTPGDIRVILDSLGGREEFHHYKIAWDVSETSARIAMSVDGKKFIDNVFAVSGFSEGPVVSPGVDFGAPDYFVLVGYPVEPTSETASGIYDEVRISNTARFDDSGVPVIDLVFSGQSFVEWFKETRKADTETVALDDVLLSADTPFEIPLGWRLRDSGITIASAIDQVTYLDPNDHLPSGYYDV